MRLDDLYHRLILADAVKAHQSNGCTPQPLSEKKPAPERGLYFWGGLGETKPTSWIISTIAFPSGVKDARAFSSFHAACTRQLTRLKG